MRRLRSVGSAIGLGAILLTAVSYGSSASAAPGDLGYEGPSYSGATNPPTADKPQSKLWHHGGSWWANMFDSGSGDWHIFRLDRSTQQWVDTGAVVDDRPNTHADALWDGSKLYIASHVVTTSSSSKPVAAVSAPSRLYRYSWTGSGFRLDAGFPSTIGGWSSESLTIDQDSTRRLWATWTQVSYARKGGWTSTVYVNSSADGGATWGSAFAVPVSGNKTSPDDISAVVAYGRSRVGVMWSNQRDGTVYWATHQDGAPVSSWQGGYALRGNGQADDHLSLKTIQADTSGRVFAAVKTSLDSVGGGSADPQIKLLVFRPGTANWSSTVVGTLSDCHTRPVVMLDTANARVHVLMTAPSSSGCPYAGAAGTIYDKTAPLDNPVFAAGRGTAIIRNSATDGVNDVTSTKQSVDRTTGLVALASDSASGRYWHADLSLGGGGTSPSPSPSPSPTEPPPPPPSAGAVTLGGSTTASGLAGTALTLVKPAGSSTGDVLLATFTADHAPSIASAPAGWTSFVPSLRPGNGASLFGYYRVLTAADDGASSWTWQLSTAEKWNGGVSRFLGVDPSRPFDTGVSTGIVSDNWSATSVTVPGITTVTPGAMVVGGYGADGSDVSVEPPAGYGETWESRGQQIAEQAHVARPTAGATGSATWTLNGGRVQAAWLTALRPRT